jgi:hypothetical protein
LVPFPCGVWKLLDSLGVTKSLFIWLTELCYFSYFTLILLLFCESLRYAPPYQRRSGACAGVRISCLRS